ncbi:lipopolysaccharide biosynthesis protein RfbH [Actinomadura kijaniata]|uniref:CDP-6-deoxy-D-xylo-4-hexulose-3-dehydrase n=1 Tax=Actinomadura namibiensis TaxID=182080 RepID=A0A7W3LZR8_ACTNM|nr:DegT/DnrJ/EryC1/StrS family aminotransferase [Actinomadura namibiensis]MBA8957348.1 CDP-6-deoxy-D-xylo-4-hexulose-3-dehydrase [Actinomadura namibiensis]
MTEPRRVTYSAAVYDHHEIDAVARVLAEGQNGLRIGPHVAEMERLVAGLFGKRRGVMVSSGSAALFLAVELLGLPAGSEVITSPLTFSTDLSALVRAGLVPVFVDVEPDTFNIDVSRIEEMVTARTRAILVPNLAGNAPDWDEIRDVADRHGLRVIEDSCDALGATLRGAPTGLRSDISVTSFSLSHIVTAAGQGGMVLLDDPDLADRCLVLRGWGRRSEVRLYGSGQGAERVFRTDLDGVPYDDMFIFDELGWNFLPTELCAAFGVQQVHKLPENVARRQRNFALYTEALARHPEFFVPPRQTDGLDTAWLCYCFLIRPDAGFDRADLQAFLEPRGVDTRTVWTGNAARQPFLKNVTFRQPDSGLPNADAVLERGVLISCSHGLTDEQIAYVGDQIDAFVAGRR